MTLKEFSRLTPDERIDKKRRYGTTQRTLQNFFYDYEERYFKKNGIVPDFTPWETLVRHFLGSGSIAEIDTEARNVEYSPKSYEDAETPSEKMLDYIVSEPEFLLGYYEEDKAGKRYFKPGVLPQIFLNELANPLDDFLTDGEFKGMNYDEIVGKAFELGINTKAGTVRQIIHNWDKDHPPRYR